MRRLMIALAASMLLAPSAALAQAAAPPDPVLDVFLDCNAPNCDSSHIRNELGFVNWVRDRTVADVHLLVTSLETGGGGREYLLAFVGLGRFAGDSTTVRLSTEQTATPVEERDRLTGRMALGLIRYAVHTGSADRITVATTTSREVGGAPADAVTGTAARDPWNAWVFSVAMDGSMEGEARETEREVSVELSANRTTEAWKLELEAEGDYRRNRFVLSDGPFVSTTQDWSVDGFVARSVARLWSAGIAARVGTSTFENQDLAVRIAPALEFSVYPYSQFSRRRVTLRYSIGANHWDYMQETLYGLMSERRWDQALDLALNFRQPWGSAWAELGGSHYLHDTGKYRLSGYVGLDIRLIRGLSLDINGGYSRVHDQLYVERDDDLTDEEVLLRLRALQTSYQYETRVGLRYTFGSIYNNIVNPRLGGGRW